ncbi:MAG: hypothetical protein WD066_01735 [Planctomycetaceae bacterium]
MLNETIDHVHDPHELRTYIHRTLCEKENLLADQFRMTEMTLTRRGKPCGSQFSLQGPRRVRLGAIWVAERNEVYFYDAKGIRYLKVRLRHRLRPERDAA